MDVVFIFQTSPSYKNMFTLLPILSMQSCIYIVFL